MPALKGTYFEKILLYIKGGTITFILLGVILCFCPIENDISPHFSIIPTERHQPHALSDCVSGHLMLFRSTAQIRIIFLVVWR